MGVRTAAGTAGPGGTATLPARASGPGRVPLVELVVRDRDLGPLRARWLPLQLEDALRLRPDRVVVDLSRCTDLGAGTLQALHDCSGSLRRQGGTLVLRGLCPRLDRLLSLAGLSDELAVEQAS